MLKSLLLDLMATKTEKRMISSIEQHRKYSCRIRMKPTVLTAKIERKFNLGKIAGCVDVVVIQCSTTKYPTRGSQCQ